MSRGRAGALDTAWRRGQRLLARYERLWRGLGRWVQGMKARTLTTTKVTSSAGG